MGGAARVHHAMFRRKATEWPENRHVRYVPYVRVTSFVSFAGATVEAPHVVLDLRRLAHVVDITTERRPSRKSTLTVLTIVVWRLK